jgi:hypothetical protein
MPLAAAVTDDTESIQSIIISGIPDGATIRDNNGHEFIASSSVTSVDVVSWNLDHLQIKAPANSDVDFTLQVVATSLDGTDTASTAPQSIHVVVEADADIPIVTANNIQGLGGTAIPLQIPATLADTDGSESLSLQLRDVPVGAVISDGAHSFTATLGNTSVDITGWALDSLMITPDLNTTNGSYILTLDATSTETQGGDQAITSIDFTLTVGYPSVNPVIGITEAVLSEDSSFNFGSNLSIQSSNPNIANTVTLQVESGTLTLGSTTGLTITETPSGITLTGSITNLNAALNGLVYKPNQDFNGFDTLGMTVDDHSGSLNAITHEFVVITVNPVNDAPIITTPIGASVGMNTSMVFSSANGSAIKIQDVDLANNIGSIQVRLTAENGTITLASMQGLTFVEGDGQNDHIMTFEGHPDMINSALDGMKFTPDSNFTGKANLNITVDDQGFGGSIIESKDWAMQVSPFLSGNPTNLVGVYPNDGSFTIQGSQLGDDGFTFQTVDGKLISVSIQTDELPNSLPNASVDDPAVLQGIPITQIMKSPQHGQLITNADEIRYIPNLTQTGTDFLSYRISENGQIKQINLVIQVINRDFISPTATSTTAPAQDALAVAESLAQGALTYATTSAAGAKGITQIVVRHEEGQEATPTSYPDFNPHSEEFSDLTAQTVAAFAIASEPTHENEPTEDSEHQKYVADVLRSLFKGENESN